MSFFFDLRGAYTFMRNELFRRGERRKNLSSRSRKNESEIVECLGMMVEIDASIEPESVFPLIRWLDSNHTERIAFITKLAEDFVSDEIIRIPQHTSYTYNRRIVSQKKEIIENIKTNKGTNNRQSFLSIWDFHDDLPVLGKLEVPCSIGYHFMERDGFLDMVYMMRSLDLSVWPNDFYLSRSVQKYFSKKCELQMGRLVFLISNLHIFISNGGEK